MKQIGPLGRPAPESLAKVRKNHQANFLPRLNEGVKQLDSSELLATNPMKNPFLQGVFEVFSFCFSAH